MKYKASIRIEYDPLKISANKLKAHLTPAFERHKLSVDFSESVDRLDYKSFPNQNRTYLLISAEREMRHLKTFHFLSMVLQGEVGLLLNLASVFSVSFDVVD